MTGLTAFTTFSRPCQLDIPRQLRLIASAVTTPATRRARGRRPRTHRHARTSVIRCSRRIRRSYRITRPNLPLPPFANGRYSRRANRAFIHLEGRAFKYTKHPSPLAIPSLHSRLAKLHLAWHYRLEINIVRVRRQFLLALVFSREDHQTLLQAVWMGREIWIRRRRSRRVERGHRTSPT